MEQMRERSLSKLEALRAEVDEVIGFVHDHDEMSPTELECARGLLWTLRYDLAAEARSAREHADRLDPVASEFLRPAVTQAQTSLSPSVYAVGESDWLTRLQWSRGYLDRYALILERLTAEEIASVCATGHRA